MGQILIKCDTCEKEFLKYPSKMGKIIFVVENVIINFILKIL